MSDIAHDNESSKTLSRTFWNRNVNQSRFISAAVGTDQFFKEGEQIRYRYHYHIPPLLTEIAATKPERLLEVGCGMANDLVCLARLGVSVYGVDFSEKSIELAQRHFELEDRAADLRVADAERLPFEDNFFSCVYSFGVLHHAPDTQRALDEVHRVLSPGGTAYVMLYNKLSLNYLAHLVLAVPFDGTRRDPCPVERAFTKSEVREMLKRFSSIDIKVDYLFGTGWGLVNALVPTYLHRALGRRIGWHLMIRAVK